MGRLSDLNALITGGANGIGRAIAIAYAREGANVAFSFKSDEGAAAELCREIEGLGRKATPIKCDFEVAGAESLLMKQALAEHKQLDVLVNNVGIVTRTPFLEIAPEQLDLVMRVNFTVPFYLSQYFAQQLIARSAQGSIINVSSLSAEMATSRVSHYQSSKAALNMLTRSIAFELGAYGIRANSISPGLTATKGNRDQWENQPEVWNKRKQEIPLNREGQPEDHAGAAVFLASKESSWMTGANLVIDGGFSLA